MSLSTTPPAITAASPHRLRAHLEVLLHPQEKKKTEFKINSHAAVKEFSQKKVGKKKHPESTSCPEGGATAKKKRKKNWFHLSGSSRSLNTTQKTKPVWSSVFWEREMEKIQPHNTTKPKTFLAFRINSSLCSSKATNKVFSRSRVQTRVLCWVTGRFWGNLTKTYGPTHFLRKIKKNIPQKKKNNPEKALQMQRHPLSLQRRD